ncbi:type II secretion system protein GspG [Myxococcus sp. K15C18031901]|uniref:type II secretion system protein GspG n=1 Tax=Myxococcus dinghuensis TaxID=2906761 RepID=UPI0020A6ED17|nr:type II secretion system protein GspG [Myxococcus dinghuensis]MCP3105295.1 type II secretion system protein GspG [Myxococcus dinghuensis]
MTEPVAQRPSSRTRTVLSVLFFLSVPVALITLAALVAIIPKLDVARRERVGLDMKDFQSALRVYNRKMGRFPSSGEGLQALVAVQAFEAMPLDPWGQPYRYAFDGEQIELTSLGEDGVRGCESDDISLRYPATPPKR